MSEHVRGNGSLEIRHPYMTKESMSNYAFVVYSKTTKRKGKECKSSGEDFNQKKEVKQLWMMLLSSASVQVTFNLEH